MKKKNNQKESTVTRVLTDETPFAIREAFNLLRTNLMYTLSDTDGSAHIYGVTSTAEGAGKSTIIVNLAISFAQLNKKVLIIDGDMRRPTLHTFFDVDPLNAGLSELLSGINDNVIVRDIKPDLDIITSGRIPPNPSELITSPKFSEYLESWKSEYDVIFIDFPPIGIVTDAVANCKMINGYIFVIRSGKSNAKGVNSCIESMEKIGAKIVGVVLNDYNMKGSVGYSRSGSRYAAKANSKYELADEKRKKESQ